MNFHCLLQSIIYKLKLCPLFHDEHEKIVCSPLSKIWVVLMDFLCLLQSTIYTKNWDNCSWISTVKIYLFNNLSINRHYGQSRCDRTRIQKYKVNFNLSLELW